MMTEDQIEQFAIERLEALGYTYAYGPVIAHDGEHFRGTTKNLAPAASPLRADPSGARVFLLHTSLLLGRRLRSSILSSSRLVWIKNTHACHPFEVLRGTPKRASHEQVLLLERLRAAVRRINPRIPAAAQEEAVKQVARIASPELLVNNEAFHRILSSMPNATLSIIHELTVHLQMTGRGFAAAVGECAAHRGIDRRAQPQRVTCRT